MKNIIACRETESESASAKKKRVIMKELVKGQEAATQLKVMLENPFLSEASLSSHQLMANVLRSFTQALSIITDDLAHRNLLFPAENGSPVAGDCSENKKRSQKGGRGRYNRRRSALTWTIVSCTTDDNHAWRKYGQKGILNSEFPRSYFRCSHKYDEGCRAMKRVQRDEENPDMYQITYIGIHTCNATPKATHSATCNWESYLLNSHDRHSKVPHVQDHHVISSPSLTIKQEFLKQNTSNDVTDHKFDPSLCSDLKDFEPSKPTIVPSKLESDDNADNVYSCTDSQRLDMDFGVASLHFGTDFHFDETRLL